MLTTLLLFFFAAGGEAFLQPILSSSSSQNNSPPTAAAHHRMMTTTTTTTRICIFMAPSEGDNNDNDNNDDSADSKADPEGAAMAAQLFQMAQAKGVTLEEDDLLPLLDDEDDDDDDDEDDDEDDDDATTLDDSGDFAGYNDNDDRTSTTTTSTNDNLTDDQLYSEVKERVLDTAGGFVDMIRGVSDSDDDDDDDDDDDSSSTIAEKKRPYEAPLKVPDPELTAGEVVLLVLDALKHNDHPTVNKGVEILFGYSSAGSQIQNEEGLTPSEYADFLKETEYKVLFEHIAATIDKGDYSFDGKKGFFTARLQTGPQPLDTVSVNFILTSEGADAETASWMVDSILIRPESMRRRRRR